MTEKTTGFLPLALASCLLALAGCKEEPPTAREQQANQAYQAANSIRFNANAEIDNIKRRLELTSDPGLLGYVVLLNEAGQPILYEGVRGKVTSGSKRLTPPDRIGVWNGVSGVRQASSDEGTWGSSSPYIFYWNTEGTYRQWSGHYIYSDKPIRLRVEPLVVTAPPPPPEAPRPHAAGGAVYPGVEDPKDP